MRLRLAATAPEELVRGAQTIATGSGIRELGRLRKRYGRGRWRKRKGFASRVAALVSQEGVDDRDKAASLVVGATPRHPPHR
jgi:hypothetical protein